MNLKIYTDEVEELARKQIAKLLAQPAFADAKVRIMPDVHAGKGCVIGFTADLGDKVIPNIVGVDIGCGMLTVALGKQKPDFAALDDILHRNIPSGMYVHREPVEAFDELDSLHCLPQLEHVKRLRCSLGSLGGGNHFVEVDADSHGNHYLIIHSGSRNLGKQVCDLYQKMAIDRRSGIGNRGELEAALIAELKEQGRQREIQSAVKALRTRWSELKPDTPADLCYLEGKGREHYLHDMKICQNFALRNREVMADIIIRRLGLEVQDMFHTTHNYIDHESNIVRKGAISARAGEKLLIPINMRDGCIYGTGKGNDDWNQSAPHGAGRLMSRSQAFRELSMEEFREQMQGIYTTSVTQKTLDESPMAYKGMDAILKHIGPTVDVVDIFKPLYNFKAEEAEPSFRKRG
ncbi:MAG: RtcB family protein [Akkermansia sp.]|nr:RtcB family protein [Akkermansia sp.]